jgi:hypothetical protein
MAGNSSFGILQQAMGCLHKETPETASLFANFNDLAPGCVREIVRPCIQ